jgi:hypothetical protein
MCAVRRSLVVEWVERDVPGGGDSSGLRGRALAAGAPTGQVLVLSPRLHMLSAGGLPAAAVPAGRVADVVAGVALGSEPVAHIAAAVTASSTSARRWTAWVAALTRASELVAAAAQVDPSVAMVALPPPRASRRPRAAAVLAGLEALGTALVRVGVAAVERTGLGRVLGWQHRRHGDVYGVVRGPRSFSSAMASGGRPTSR